MIEQALVGLIAGFVYAVIGWWKKLGTEEKQAFNLKRAIATIVAGVMAGGLAGAGDIPMDSIIEILTLAFATIGATDVTVAKFIKNKTTDE